MPITNPLRLLEAAAEEPAAPAPAGKIKLNFGRISKKTVESMARQSLYIYRNPRTPDGAAMPDPVEKVGKRPVTGSPPLPPVAM